MPGRIDTIDMFWPGCATSGLPDEFRGIGSSPLSVADLAG
jgi:hypothetical protein